MKVPESSIKIMSHFQSTVKTGDSAELDKIPLKDIKMAKAHLAYEENQPFYVFMLDYIQERERKEGSAFSGKGIKKDDFIFISHIGEEAPMAILLKKLLTSTFKDISVFVSSDFESIRTGKKWYDVIIERARAAKIVIVLLSKQSIHQPWISFEAGIGAGAYGEVMPIVGRNIKINDIPPPLKFRQARDLRDPEGVKALLRDVSKTLDQTEPVGDWSNFTREFVEITKKIPYQELYLEPYYIRGDNGTSNIIQFKLINNGTTDMSLIAVEGAVPENLLLQNWARPNSIPNLSEVKVEQVNGQRKFRYTCYAYSGPIPPGYGYPHRLPECLTPSMSPHDFSTLRFALRADLSEDDLNQTIEYKVLAKEFITETHSMTIRELLNKTG